MGDDETGEQEPAGEVDAHHVGPQHAAAHEGHDRADVVRLDREVGRRLVSTAGPVAARHEPGVDVRSQAHAGVVRQRLGSGQLGQGADRRGSLGGAHSGLEVSRRPHRARRRAGR